ncbi:hypothetical protein F4Y93_01095 [Candidatus Poribacteria bacterium]|nr:hypothetical protein [Candidatus Poribacteria bacterium]
METLQTGIEPAASSTDKVLFREQVQHELDETRREAEEAYALDKEIDPIPDSAYNDTLVLLEMLCNYKLPMPEVSWAEDGSFSIGWYLDEGIITTGIYGDDLVIYNAFFEEKRQFEGICALSDTPMLSGFLKILIPILNRIEVVNVKRIRNNRPETLEFL